jgi:hypothetical protein
MAAARALDRRTRVLQEHLGAGEALVVFRDRRQHLRELPGLAIGLEFFRRDGIAGFVNVSLEHREGDRALYSSDPAQTVRHQLADGPIAVAAHDD